MHGEPWWRARTYQFVLVISILYLSWLGLMVVHELGHVTAASLSGGIVSGVVLHPLAFSRTDLSQNPHSAFVAWAGGGVGVIVPLVALGAGLVFRWRYSYLLRFFAGFCLIGNGAYLAGGSWEGVGDAGELIQHGTPRWVLLVFGLATIPAGLFLWHGEGGHFGLGPSQGVVDHNAALGVLALLILTVALELITGHR